MPHSILDTASFSHAPVRMGSALYRLWRALVVGSTQQAVSALHNYLSNDASDNFRDRGSMLLNITEHMQKAHKLMK